MQIYHENGVQNGVKVQKFEKSCFPIGSWKITYNQSLQALSLSLKDVTWPSPTILFNVREQISEMAWVRG